MNKRFFSLPLLLLSVLFCSMFFTSCNDNEEKARLTKAEKERLRIEDSLALKIGILPTTDCDALRLADSLHIFADLGVDVNFRRYNALSECRIALKLNLVEGAVIDSALAEIIREKDSVSLFLGPATSLSWKIITSKKSRIVRTEQLVDKIIAADSHGNSRRFAEQMTDSLVKKEKNVYIIQCEDLAVRTKMLSTGNVDAAFLPEPFASSAIKSGGKVLRDFTSQSKGVIAFRKKALDDKRRKQQYDLFLKGLAIAKDSLERRRK